MMPLVTYGDIPVPQTVGWTNERPYSIGYCPFVRSIALQQPQGRGGRPDFRHPNFDRQRRTIVCGLCDLCGRELKTATKVSLSMLQEQTRQFSGGTGLVQVEPLLHRDCAIICLRHCPHLLRASADGRLSIRQVTKWRVQYNTLPPETIGEQVPHYAGPRDGVAGYAFIELLKWQNRPVDWLRGTKA
jgi:hypothetical protein